jgi:hypothetical protein
MRSVVDLNVVIRRIPAHSAAENISVHLIITGHPDDGISMVVRNVKINETAGC